MNKVHTRVSKIWIDLLVIWTKWQGERKTKRDYLANAILVAVLPLNNWAEVKCRVVYEIRTMLRQIQHHKIKIQPHNTAPAKWKYTKIINENHEKNSMINQGSKTQNSKFSNETMSQYNRLPIYYLFTHLSPENITTTLEQSNLSQPIKIFFINLLQTSPIFRGCIATSPNGRK